MYEILEICCNTTSKPSFSGVCYRLCRYISQNGGLIQDGDVENEKITQLKSNAVNFLKSDKSRK